MKRFSVACLLMASVSCLAMPEPVYAQQLIDPPSKKELDDKQIVSFVLENDLFSGTDRYYTNGFRLAYLTSEQRAPEWVQSVVRHLPFADKRNYRISMALGQNMYVPSSIEIANPSPDDRPYAGWLYGSLGLVSDSGRILRTAMITLGVVGPSSLAEETQKLVHRVVDSPRPQGWDHQLKDEPGVVLTLEQKWRSLYRLSATPISKDLKMDVTPHIGVNLGNVHTDATAGATFRLGFDLPADYGPPRIRPSLPGSDFFIPTERWGGYLFAGVEGRAVGRNIFLDGNSFRSSPHVDKNYWVGSAQLGAAVTYESVRVSYTHVFQTHEFKTQQKSAQFGAVTVSVRF